MRVKALGKGDEYFANLASLSTWRGSIVWPVAQRLVDIPRALQSHVGGGRQRPKPLFRTKRRIYTYDLIANWCQLIYKDRQTDPLCSSQSIQQVTSFAWSSPFPPSSVYKRCTANTAWLVVNRKSNINKYIKLNIVDYIPHTGHVLKRKW